MILKNQYFFLRNFYLNKQINFFNKYVEIILYAFDLSKKKLEFFNIRGKVVSYSFKTLKVFCKINNFKFFYLINVFNKRIITFIMFNK